MAEQYPTTEKLRDFLLGKLCESEHNSVAEYLEAHPEVVDCLPSVEESDSLASDLRQPTEFSGEPAYQRGLMNARSILSATCVGSIPNRIGPYQLLARIDRKRTGGVFVGHDVNTGHRAAVKLLWTDENRTPGATERFRRETKLLQGLNHPNVVRFLGSGESDGILFLAMELLHGLDLSDLVRKTGPLPIDVACTIVRNTAKALQHTSDKRLVHRDVKPSNIFLTANGDVKLLDVGLARLFSDGNQSLTHSDHLLGTVDYMAPEQAFDTHDADIRSDIYSLGCTFYKLLTGDAPFSGSEFRHPLKKVLAHSSRELVPVSTRRDDIPPAVAEIVHRMCAKQPSDRFQAAAAVVDSLEPFSNAESLRLFATEHATSPPFDDEGQQTWTSEAAVETPVTKENSASRLWLAGAVVVTIVAAVFGWKSLSPLSENLDHTSQIEFDAVPNPEETSTDTLRLDRESGTENDAREFTTEQAETLTVASPRIDIITDREKLAARTVIECGGLVWIAGRASPIRQTAELPDNEITVTRIEISKQAVSVADMESISNLPSLETVRISGANLTDGGVRQLCSNPELKLLWLYDNPITNECLTHIAGLSQLESLNINNTRITDLSVLSVLKNLTSLYVAFLRVDDTDLRVLPDLPKLEVLHLHATPITDECILTLLKVSNLKVLYIPGTQISHTGAAKLHENLPDCEIIRSP